MFMPVTQIRGVGMTTMVILNTYAGTMRMIDNRWHDGKYPCQRVLVISYLPASDRSNLLPRSLVAGEQTSSIVSIAPFSDTALQKQPTSHRFWEFERLQSQREHMK